ncbi:MAG: hypothetical protein SVY53_14525 [Chloroflexota bacterium]|nr:hypothetical protein [Chloroflexota bacterium]
MPWKSGEMSYEGITEGTIGKLEQTKLTEDELKELEEKLKEENTIAIPSNPEGITS